MVNEGRIQSMEENEVKMDKIQHMLDLAKEEHEVKTDEIQQMLDSAKNNHGYSFVNLSLQVGVQGIGMTNIEQVAIWNQKTQQAVTFVL
eukprot:CAMPEP_0185748230 /NCGR_PEP_ID=MMETSP1174-20130828/6897_1 /TAXON_ID=35687 /ORGANISM="Dictyocha speculum, Strain CCMP1381" /LENGTH=88 /DNA_ID=CAMNT_0028423779 /DNA_START=68 /DNA_END=334 /DNA_ORIENTATION=+